MNPSSNYQNFDFDNSVLFKSYFENLYPTPTYDQLEKIRRKWYKSNIDPSFDIETVFEQKKSGSQSSDVKSESNINANTSKNQSNDHQNCSDHNHSHNYIPQAAQSTISNKGMFLFKIEGYLKVIFIFSIIVVEDFSNLIAFIVCLLALYRQCKTPKWNKEYARKLMFNEFFHNLWYMIPFWLFPGQRNLMYYLPLICHFWIGFCEFLNLNNGFLNNYLQKIIDLTRNNRKRIIIWKQHLEILLLPILFIGIFLARTNIMIIILVSNYIRIKYVFNQNTKDAFGEINSVIKNKIVKDYRITNWFYSKICWFCDYMVNPKNYTKKEEEKKTE